MMVMRISTTELKDRFPGLLELISDNSESVQIERDGQLIATIVPAPKKAMTWNEFEERFERLPVTDEDFAEDVRSIRDTHQPLELPEWPS